MEHQWRWVISIGFISAPRRRRNYDGCTLYMCSFENGILCGMCMVIKAVCMQTCIISCPNSIMAYLSDSYVLFMFIHTFWSTSYVLWSLLHEKSWLKMFLSFRYCSCVRRFHKKDNHLWGVSLVHYFLQYIWQYGLPGLEQYHQCLHNGTLRGCPCWIHVSCVCMHTTTTVTHTRLRVSFPSCLLYICTGTDLLFLLVVPNGTCKECPSVPTKLSLHLL